MAGHIEDDEEGGPNKDLVEKGGEAEPRDALKECNRRRCNHKNGNHVGAREPRIVANPLVEHFGSCGA